LQLLLADATASLALQLAAPGIVMLPTGMWSEGKVTPSYKGDALALALKLTADRRLNIPPSVAAVVSDGH
jgi:hypothetical protein